MRVINDKKLYQVTFMPRLFPVNCYIVEEQEELTLVDAALPYGAKGILTAAERIGKPITRIVLTHAHEDHVGALDQLKKALPDIPVYISAREARLMEGDMSLDPHELNVPIKGGVPKNLQARPDILLKDGDEIGSLIAVSAPGHTPGSMAFYDKRTSALIAGDAFQTRGGIAVAGQLKPLFPFPAFGTWDKFTALKSARKLHGLKPTLLAVGHGDLLFEPDFLMQKSINQAEGNLQRRGKNVT